jgi:hypothetical protein
MLILIIILVCQKYSSSLIYKPSLISGYLESRLSCQSFSSDGRKDEGVNDKNKVRKWEPRDHLASTERTNERLRSNLPQLQQTQSPVYRQKSPGDPNQQTGRFETQHEVDIFIENNLRECKRRDISDLFRISAKVSKRNRRVSYLEKHLPAIILQLRELSSSSWSFQEISGVVYGLQFMTTDDMGVIDILSVMTLVAIKSIGNVQSIQSLQGQHISMLLYGLQSMNSRHEVIRRLLSVVAVMVSNCSDKFGPQAIGNAFYGLQGMSSDYSEVCDVLLALAIKVSTCEEEVSAQAVGNAFYSLKNMSSDSAEVRQVLSALAIKVRSCKENLDDQGVGNAFYGLQGMRSDSTEVRDVLSALAIKVCICIFYYLFVDSFIYAFGWSAFLCRIRFCDTLIVTFFK